ncbi:unnamed protein product [Urochloa humidicola]
MSCLTGNGEAGSSAAEYLVEHFEDEEIPVTPDHTTTLTDTEPAARSRQISPSTGPWFVALLAEAGKLKLSEEDPALRRSCRKKAQNKGYKGACQDRKCLACDADPPTLLPSVIRNLGADFCKIDAKKLTNARFLKRRKVAAPGGKKLASKAKPKGPNGLDKDKEPKKKARK